MSFKKQNSAWIWFVLREKNRNRESQILFWKGWKSSGWFPREIKIRAPGWGARRDSIAQHPSSVSIFRKTSRQVEIQASEKALSAAFKWNGGQRSGSERDCTKTTFWNSFPFSQAMETCFSVLFLFNYFSNGTTDSTDDCAIWKRQAENDIRVQYKLARQNNSLKRTLSHAGK